MNCKLPDITITGPQLSDLFFNHEHPNYDACVEALAGDTSMTTEEYTKHRNAALLADATEFANIVSGGCNWGVNPSALVEDFMARL